MNKKLKIISPWGTGLPFLGICSEHKFSLLPLSTTKNPGHHLQNRLKKTKK